MSLPQAVIMATEAVKLDQAGTDDKQALVYYIDACSELLKVIKSEPDAVRKSGLTKRMNTYMVRAEQLKKRMRRAEWQREKAREAQRRALIYWGSETFGPELQSGACRKPTKECLDGKRIVLLFFGANWCTECVAFRKKLAKLYVVKDDEVSKDDFEIVFVSSDQDQNSFDKFWEDAPWLALPFDNRRQKGLLGAKYNINSRKLPRVIVLDGKNGSVISQFGEKDFEGCSNVGAALDKWLEKSSVPAPKPPPTSIDDSSDKTVVTDVVPPEIQNEKDATTSDISCTSDTQKAVVGGAGDAPLSKDNTTPEVDK